MLMSRRAVFCNFFLVLSGFITQTLSDSFSKGQGGGHQLFRWPAESVGNIRQIDMGDGSVAHMVTKSLKPTVFVIDDFLSEGDCDQLIKKAEKEQLVSTIEEDRKILEKSRAAQTKVPSQFLDFDFLDENKNGRIDLLEEVQTFAYKFNNIYLNEFEVTEIFKIFRIEVKTQNEKMFIPKEEFMKLDLNYFFDYLNTLKATHPVHADRHFDYTTYTLQTSTDPLLTKIYSKVQKLTNIHPEILQGMEPLEVSKFSPYGHHFTHFESDDAEKSSGLPCCHHTSSKKTQNCRQCRFLTLMVFLNDDSGPGEAVFPVADDPTYSYEKFVDKSDHDLTNLVHHCEKSKLSITPKKGTAIMWYNHDISPQGHLGAHDHYSLFGQCNVYYNEKWVATTRVLAHESPEFMTKSVHRSDYGSSQEFEKDTKRSSKPDL